jgi:hypothetical protein
MGKVEGGKKINISAPYKINPGTTTELKMFVKGQKSCFVLKCL